MVGWLPLQVEPGDFGSILSLFGNRMQEGDASLALLRDFPDAVPTEGGCFLPIRRGPEPAFTKPAKRRGSLNPRHWVKEGL